MSILGRIFGNSSDEPKRPVERETTRARNEALLTEYSAGVPIKEIAERYHMTAGAVYQVALKNGVNRPARAPHKIHKKPSEDYLSRNKEICDRYVAGESCGDLALAFNVTRERVCQILREQNLISLVHERRRLAKEALAEEAGALQEKVRAEFNEKIERAAELVRNGESFRKAAIAVGFQAHSQETKILSEKCRREGFNSKHGRHRDFAERERRLRELVAGGLSLNAAVTKMREEGDNIFYNWALSHCPDLISIHKPAQKSKEQTQSKPRRSPAPSAELADWTDEKQARLIELWFNGNSAQQISDIFGPPFTRNSIIGKIHRLRNDGAFKRPDPPEPKPVLSVVK